LRDAEMIVLVFSDLVVWPASHAQGLDRPGLCADRCL
jgi:hypothetical protein